MKTNKYILICLLGIFSFLPLTGINTVTYAVTDRCVTHPEECDPCYEDPDLEECNEDDEEDDCHDDNSCSCDEDPNQDWCPHDCHYYNNCSCDEDPDQAHCPKKDPCKENPNLPQCKKNPCPNGVQDLSYCMDKPGEQAACESIAQREADNKTGSCVQCVGKVCKVEPPKPPCGDGACSFDERCSCAADCGAPLPGSCGPVIPPIGVNTCIKKTFLTMPDILNPNSFSDICTLNTNTFIFWQSGYENSKSFFTGLCMPSKVECQYTIESIDPPTSTSGTTPGTTSGTTPGTTSGTTPGTTSGTTLGTTGGTGNFSISGIIISGGSPLGNINVNLFKTSDTNLDNTISTTTTNNNGVYTFTGIDTGDYTVIPKSTGDVIFIKTSTVNLTDGNVENINFNAVTKNDPNFNDYVDVVTKNQITSGTSVSDWLTDILGTSRQITSGTGAIDMAAAGISNLNGRNNILSSNSLLSLLEKGYSLESGSYSPIPLSLINKLLNQNAICGNGKIEDGETCDAGKDNGITNKCSSDCLYIGEVRGSDNNLVYSSAIDEYNGENYNRGGRFQNSLKTLGSISQKGRDIAGSIINSVEDVYDASANLVNNAKEATRDFIVANTSPETRAIMKKTAEVAVVAAEYSVIGVSVLLGVTAASLNVMVFKSQWKTYTVLEGDNIDAISSRFNMTERALRRKNGKLKKGQLRPGMKIRVKNRTFIEKDYLDQLKSVLTDSLKTKNGHMAGKIEKMFAKK